jgi:glycosyltransferase involved in cell wall biosynthesis
VLIEVDCVVVSYNSAADLPACIDSLTSQNGISARVVVVDNLSSDDSVETAQRRGSGGPAQPTGVAAGVGDETSESPFGLRVVDAGYQPPRRQHRSRFAKKSFNLTVHGLSTSAVAATVDVSGTAYGRRRHGG